MQTTNWKVTVEWVAQIGTIPLPLKLQTSDTQWLDRTECFLIYGEAGDCPWSLSPAGLTLTFCVRCPAPSSCLLHFRFFLKEFFFFLSFFSFYFLQDIRFSFLFFPLKKKNSCLFSANIFSPRIIVRVSERDFRGELVHLFFNSRGRKDYVGSILKMQVLGPHPRRFCFSASRGGARQFSF